MFFIYAIILKMSELDDLNKEPSSLDRFKKRLERGGEDKLTLRSTRLPKASFNLRRDWGGDEAVTHNQLAGEKTSRGWLFKIFFGALFFFLATLAVAIYVLFFSTNIVSTNNIDLEIKGPNQVRSGDELNLEATVRNRNKVTLRNVSLTITYPAGTIEAGGGGSNLPLWRENLNDLNPGQSLTIGSKAILFGAQNSNQTINLKIEYHIPESNAVFTKETDYNLLIGSATLDLSLDLPSEINSGKSFTANLKVTSNAQTLLRQTAIKIEYPGGFTFQSTEPTPSVGNNVWFLGDLSPGVTREIKIVGSLVGQSEEVKSFKLTAGLDRSSGQGDISTEYGSLFKTVNLKRDFVSAVIDLGNQTSVLPGGELKGLINWSNNLSDQVINGTVQLFLAGVAIDKRSIRGTDGFYNSLDNSISWDKNSLESLGQINPSGGDNANFSFSILPIEQLPSGSVPPINLRLVFRGTRVTADDNGEEIVTEASKTIKIGSLVDLKGRGVYSVGPFKNTGPLPPKVGEETTYTVTLSVNNSTNEIKNAKVRTILPPYIKWLSVISPLDEKLIYDDTNKEVLWDLGSIKADTGGTGNPVREASFQLVFTPSLSQVGSIPDLTKSINFVGVDSLTGEAINLSLNPLNIRLSTDPGFSYGMEKVIE